MEPNENKTRVWITGAGGFIGRYLAKAALVRAPQFQAIPLTRQDLDLTDFAAVERKFQADQPTIIIHCAAMSRSPACQADPPLARLLNVDVTANLAKLARNIDFIFFSTDLVFDGHKGNYTEIDSPNPLSAYAETKIAAEQIVLSNARHTVIRTSLNAGTSPRGNHAFNEELMESMRAGKTLNLFYDEYRCPIPAEATARAVWELAALRARGIYHLAGGEKLSRLEIGRLVAAKHPELNPKINSCSLREYNGAPRVADASLDCGKIQKLLSFPLPGLTSWMAAQ